MKKIICLTLLSCIFFELSAHYPFTPQTAQTEINGTIGEERAGRTRYHKGLDLQKAAYTPVYSISTGAFSMVGNSPKVGTLVYVHVDVNPTLYNQYLNRINLNNNVPPLIVNVGDQIGRVQNISNTHVHLQETAAFTQVSSIHSDVVNWVNPIINRNPLDSIAPKIDFARLYMDKNSTTDISLQNILFGKLDVLVNSEDGRINTNGGLLSPLGTNSGYGNAPLKITWSTEKNNVVVNEVGGISFDVVPLNTSATTVHGPGASWTVPNHEYWLTHDPFNTPYDKYWNIRKLKGGIFSESAAYPWDAEYKDASDLKIKTTACNHRSNCTDYFVGTDATHPTGRTYTIDNFKPFIKNVSLQGNNPRDVFYSRAETAA